MNTRIREVRKILRLNQTEFGKAIGITHSSLSDIENGNCTITERIIIAICLRFNVNENWLRHGKGNIFIEKNIKYDEFFTLYDKLKPPLQDFLFQTSQNLLNTQNKL